MQVPLTSKTSKVPGLVQMYVFMKCWNMPDSRMRGQKLTKKPEIDRKLTENDREGAGKATENVMKGSYVILKQAPLSLSLF